MSAFAEAQDPQYIDDDDDFDDLPVMASESGMTSPERSFITSSPILAVYNTII
jgi:hypothetical protein